MLISNRWLAALRQVVTLGTSVLVCSAAVQAQAQQPPPSAAAAVVRSWQFGDLRFKALSSGVLQTWLVQPDGSERLTDERQLGGAIVDLRLQAGILVAMVLAPQPRLLQVDSNGQVGDYRVPVLAGDSTGTAAESGWAGSKPIAMGRVTAGKHGEAEVELQVANDVVVGGSALIRPQPYDNKGPMADMPARSSVVGWVARLSSDGKVAWVELPRGAAAEAGDTVERATAAAERYRFIPPRSDYETWFAGYLRPVTPIGDVGIGAGFEFGIGGRGLGIAVRGNPVTFSAKDGVGPTLLDVSLLFDGDVYGFGLGGGLAKPTNRFCNFSSISGSFDCGTSSDWVWAGSVDLRLGAQDGGHLRLRFASGPEVNGSQFFQTDGHLQIPVWRTVDVRIAWTARQDYAHFEVGGRVFLRGNGDRDSTILTFGLGGIEAEASGRDLEGPMMTLGLEWRR